jgi:hypothetical protein
MHVIVRSTHLLVLSCLALYVGRREDIGVVVFFFSGLDGESSQSVTPIPSRQGPDCLFLITARAKTVRLFAVVPRVQSKPVAIAIDRLPLLAPAIYAHSFAFALRADAEPSYSRSRSS